MRRIFFFLFQLSVISVFAQESLDYQKPSKEILDLVDVPLAPSVFIDDDNQNMVFAYRDSYKTIEELSKEELRLGGLRIDPQTNISSRISYYNNLKVKNIKDDGEVVQVEGLPGKPKLANFNFSPDQTKIAFTHTAAKG